MNNKPDSFSKVKSSEKYRNRDIGGKLGKKKKKRWAWDRTFGEEMSVTVISEFC